jgi:serine/threonine protein kinase
VPVADFEVDWHDLQLGEVLGQGAFGRVYAARWRGTAVAVKTLIMPLCQSSAAQQLESLADDFKAEVAVISALRHPNVLLFMGACTSDVHHLALVTELAPRGSLWDLIHTAEEPLQPSLVIQLALGIARGMAYLHSHRPAAILHRDLKSANILLDCHGGAQGTLVVKVSDFGLARVKAVSLAMSIAGQMTGGIGTFQWMSPEVLANEAYTESADVYSFGIILWEMMSREVPFARCGGNQMQIAIQVMTAGLRPELEAIPSFSTGSEGVHSSSSGGSYVYVYPPALVHIMTSCWGQSPHQRPTFMHVIQALEDMQAAL